MPVSMTTAWALSSKYRAKVFVGEGMPNRGLSVAPDSTLFETGVKLPPTALSDPPLAESANPEIATVFFPRMAVTVPMTRGD